MHHGRDSEGVTLNLALAHLGIVVYQVSWKCELTHSVWLTVVLIGSVVTYFTY
jgi:hypothetical protein